MENEDSLLQTLIQEDDITWQSIIYELVKTEQMDPWDVDISILSDKFMKMIDEMRETNLKISGKVILAATIMLRLKSARFIDVDLAQLEKLISSAEEYGDEFIEEIEEGLFMQDPKTGEKYAIFPRTPQPRKRKVSIYDLMDALSKVIDVSKRKNTPKIPVKKMEIPLKKFDINYVLKEVFVAVNAHYDSGKKSLKFSELTPSDRREDKISTFIPLLHLTNQRVTDLDQKEAFDDFSINLIRRGLKYEDLDKVAPDESQPL